MSTTELELVFEGRAVESGTIDADVLGTSLSAYSEIFRRANELANGEASEAVVLVESDFEAASFDVSLLLVQNLVEHSKILITAHPFLTAADLAATIGLVWSKRESLIKVLQWLKSKKPEKVTQIGNEIELVLLGQKKVISNTVNIFLNDPPMRASLARAVQPLRRPGIDRIRLRPKGTTEPGVEPAVIEKDEVPYFEPDPLQLAALEAPDEGERETVLIIAKLSFEEGPKWTFYERGATVVAKIADKEFWGDIHRGRLKFGEGDRLRVRLHWKMVQKRNKKLVPQDTIMRVYEVLPRAK